MPGCGAVFKKLRSPTPVIVGQFQPRIDKRPIDESCFPYATHTTDEDGSATFRNELTAQSTQEVIASYKQSVFGIFILRAGFPFRIEDHLLYWSNWRVDERGLFTPRSEPIQPFLNERRRAGVWHSRCQVREKNGDEEGHDRGQRETNSRMDQSPCQQRTEPHD